MTINLGTNHWHYLLNPVIGLRATLGLTLIYNLSHIPPAPTRCLLPLPTGKVLCPPQEGNLGAHLHKADSLCSTLIPQPTFPALKPLVMDDLEGNKTWTPPWYKMLPQSMSYFQPLIKNASSPRQRKREQEHRECKEKTRRG